MHRINTADAVANMFNAGDPLVPRLPTQVDPTWLNSVQEEIVGVILAAGIALSTGSDAQLLAAITTLAVNLTGTQTIGGAKTFSTPPAALNTAKAWAKIQFSGGVPTVLASHNIAATTPVTAGTSGYAAGSVKIQLASTVARATRCVVAQFDGGAAQCQVFDNNTGQGADDTHLTVVLQAVDAAGNITAWNLSTTAATFFVICFGV